MGKSTLNTVPNAPDPIITVFFSSDSLIKRSLDRSGPVSDGTTGSVIPKQQYPHHVDPHSSIVSNVSQ